MLENACKVKYFVMLATRASALLGISFASFLFALPVSSQELFHSLGCGSGCRVDYYVVRGPYYDKDRLSKVLVREVKTSGGGGGAPLKRKSKQTWILADCSLEKINLSSQSSNGRDSHADASGWDRVNYDDETNYGYGIRELYAKLCK